MTLRNRFLLLAAPCMINAVAMFFVAFGAAFGGPQRVLLWPALGLLAACLLLLALLSAIRAGQVGNSPGLAFVSVILSAAFGPALIIPVAYLAFKPELQPTDRQETAGSSWLSSLVLLALPWLVLGLFGLGRIH